MELVVPFFLVGVWFRIILLFLIICGMNIGPKVLVQRRNRYCRRNNSLGRQSQKARGYREHDDADHEGGELCVHRVQAVAAYDAGPV